MTGCRPGVVRAGAHALPQSVVHAVDDVGVVTGTSLKDVVTLAAAERVVVRIADQDVGASTSADRHTPAPRLAYALDPDRPDDRIRVLSQRQLDRLVFVAAETARRLAREGSPVDPAAWRHAPRRSFGGASAMEACRERDAFLRARLLHATGVALDLEPREMDELIDEGWEGLAVDEGDDRSDTVRGMRRAGVARGLPPRLRFDADRRIIQVAEPRASTEDPGHPFPRKIERLTGPTELGLVGQSIDDALACRIIASADIVIAHSSSDGFRNIAGARGACSPHDVVWRSARFDGRRLGQLLVPFGWFFDAHRAEHDVLAPIRPLDHAISVAEAV